MVTSLLFLFLTFCSSRCGSFRISNDWKNARDFRIFSSIFNCFSLILHHFLQCTLLYCNKTSHRWSRTCFNYYCSRSFQRPNKLVTKSIISNSIAVAAHLNSVPEVLIQPCSSDFLKAVLISKLLLNYGVQWFSYQVKWVTCFSLSTWVYLSNKIYVFLFFFI